MHRIEIYTQQLAYSKSYYRFLKRRKIYVCNFALLRRCIKKMEHYVRIIRDCMNGTIRNILASNIENIDVSHS